MQPKHILLCLSTLATFSAYAQQQKVITEADSKDGKVLTYVEQMPKAGYDYLDFLNKNIHYPDSAIAHDITGRVIVRFIVNEDGHISDVTAIRGVGGGLDQEAVRVVSMFPPWKPGIQKGKPVKVFFTLPIVFSLDDPKDKAAPKGGK
jgi:periplasmic protein TonB